MKAHEDEQKFEAKTLNHSEAKIESVPGDGEELHGTPVDLIET